MKNNNQLFTLLVTLLAAAVLVLPGQSLAKMNQAKGQTLANGNCPMPQLPLEELSMEEEAGLIQMREEEKLARDVYAALYEKWQDPIFSHISQSENRHSNAVKRLINKYSLTDPVTDPTAGVFTNPQLLALYNQFVEQGGVSLVEALKVGAAIEDLDIKDLQTFIVQADNTDIKLVYKHLLRGSRNHLRAFAYRLSLLGVAYEAQSITNEELETILASPRETGDGNGDGGPAFGGKGRAGAGKGMGMGMGGKGGDCPNP